MSWIPARVQALWFRAWREEDVSLGSRTREDNPGIPGALEAAIFIAVSEPGRACQDSIRYCYFLE